MSLGMIDKAFLEAERSMPAGYALTCLGWRHGGWIAEARPVEERGYLIRSRRLANSEIRRQPSVQGDGATPQEALLNLATALDVFRENTKLRRKHDSVDAIVQAVLGAVPA